MLPKIKIPNKLNNINIIELPEHTTLTRLRTYLSRINFNDPQIYVLLVPPGVGKTHTVKETLKKEESFLAVTSSHKLIGEEYKKLGAKHWASVKDNCERYNRIKDFHKAKVPIGMICKNVGCDLKKCKYWQQFNAKKVVAPFHYLSTDRVKRKNGNNYGKQKGDFKFDILVIDESMMQYNYIAVNKDEVVKAFDVMEKYRDVSHLREFLLDSLDDDFGILYMADEEILSEINRNKNKALSAAMKEKNLDDVKAISKLNVPELQKYSYYKEIYGEFPYYPEPYFYEVFDLVRQNVPVVLLDATFDRRSFRILLERYLYENKKIDRSILLNKKLRSADYLKVNSFEGNLEDKTVIVYRMDENNNYYKSSFFQYRNGKPTELHENGRESLERLKYFIEGLKKKYKKVGIITYKILESEFRQFGPTDYYFNLKGSNKMKNMDALVLIGTPSTNQGGTVKEYNDLCMTNITEKEVYRRRYIRHPMGNLIQDDIEGKTYSNPEGAGFDEKKPFPLRIKGYDPEKTSEIIAKQEDEGAIDVDLYYSLSNFDMAKSESEKYQAIHRARLFREGKVPDVFIFGDVPERIKKEFHVIKNSREETNEFAESLHGGILPSVLYLMIHNYSIYNTPNTEKIAKDFKLYKSSDKKSGYNYPFINKIIKGKIPSNIMIHVDKAVLKGFKCAASMKKEIKELKNIDEQFLQDCIYYFKNGRFINAIF